MCCGNSERARLRLVFSADKLDFLHPPLTTGGGCAFGILFEDSSPLQNLQHHSLLPLHLCLEASGRVG